MKKREGQRHGRKGLMDGWMVVVVVVVVYLHVFVCACMSMNMCRMRGQERQEAGTSQEIYFIFYNTTSQ